MNTSSQKPMITDLDSNGQSTHKAERWLRNIAAWAFAVSTLAFSQAQGDGPLAKACSIIFPLGYLVAFVFLTLLGFYHFHKSQHQKSLLNSVMLAIWRAFLYIFLPALLLTGGLVLWGILTHQPAFTGQ